MTLVERLREFVGELREDGWQYASEHMHEAADRIEALAATLQWTRQVHAQPDAAGNVKVTMTLEEFQAMREALGERP